MISIKKYKTYVFFDTFNKVIEPKSNVPSRAFKLIDTADLSLLKWLLALV